MQKTFEVDNFNMLINSIKQYVRLCHTSIESLQTTESLSVDGFAALQSAKKSILQINRIANLFEYLLMFDDFDHDYISESFDINEMTSEMVRSLNKRMLSHLNAEMRFSTKIQRHMLIQINRTKFELLIFNILYCCIKNNILTSMPPTKISLYLTEDRKFYIFHIRSNGISMPTKLIERILNNTEPIQTFDSSSSPSALGLAIAKKLIDSAGGRIKFSALKSSCRFDIYFPQKPAGRNISMRSPSVYRMDAALANETFSDLFIMKTEEDSHVPSENNS